MHGVKRDRQQLSSELKAQRKEKEKKKLELYKSIEDQFFAFRKDNVATLEALELTTHLLHMNPELYTAWNYRRKVLGCLFDKDFSDVDTVSEIQSSKDIFASARVNDSSSSALTTDVRDDRMRKERRKQKLLIEDLDLTIEVLKIHPKVYWIWNHRKWCLEQLPSDDAEKTAKWTTEIQMVNKMLDMDARNFHGWNYRRYILTRLAAPETLHSDDLPPFPASLSASNISRSLKLHQLKLAEAELAYTLVKIESNFSNFSAWHHRALLLIPIWTAKALDEAQLRKARDEEFELIRQAMYVDPDDQSVWTYHSWLIGLDPMVDVLEREIASVRELLELEAESKWCMISLAESLSLLEKGSEDEDRRSLYRREATELLQQLIDVDPDRRERYQDLIKAATS
ncbi:hypothetical protein CBS101457_003943 [Exobasidium rhododendri]|nr:hypothetical protein CBS101457_003943 [Exobasidium rhododendri]